jgi:hypothetical protein
MNVKGLSECDNLGKNLNLRIFVEGVETSSEHVDTGLSLASHLNAFFLLLT